MKSIIRRVAGLLDSPAFVMGICLLGFVVWAVNVYLDHVSCSAYAPYIDIRLTE